MTDRQQIIEAMRAAGVEDAGKPRTRSYTNPRHVEQVEEPATEEQNETPSPAQTTSTRPVPTGEPGPHLPPRGGSNPEEVIELPHEEVKSAVERAWARQQGHPVPPKRTVSRQGGWNAWTR